MEKVTDQYSPEIARHKLNAYFSGNLIMLDVIKGLQKSSLCVFAALCDGKRSLLQGMKLMPILVLSEPLRSFTP